MNKKEPEKPHKDIYYPPSGSKQFTPEAKTAWYRLQSCAYNNQIDNFPVILTGREAAALKKSEIDFMELCQAGEDTWIIMREKFMNSFESVVYQDMVEVTKNMKGTFCNTHYKDIIFEKNKDYFNKNNT